MRLERKVYLGFDLGASSGRAVIGILENGRLAIEEVKRFANAYLELDGTLYWNFLELWSNVVDSMRCCAQAGYRKLAGIAVDTWGVDFGLLGTDGKLIGQPICYRDESTRGMPEVIESKISREQMYKLTGIQLCRVATLPQLLAINSGPGKSRLKAARHFLMMPGLFRFFMCGDCSVELSAAGSTLMLDVHKNRWSRRILRACGLPGRIFPDIIMPGSVVGRLKRELAQHAGLNRAPVVAVAGHDTLSSAAALPCVEEDCAFISCGTWSVLGQMRSEPVTTKQALEYGFVNEPGLASILFGRNMMGLYVFEGLHRALVAAEERMTYAAMVQAATRARPFKCMLDMDSPIFFVTQAPAADVEKFLKSTGQRVRLGKGELIRSILEGLAFSYREALRQLSELTGRRYSKLSLVGGGIRNRLLCQMVADATGLEVTAGPAEATIAGNFGVQALAVGQLKNPGEIRELVGRSFKIKTYKPKNRRLWDKQYRRYREILSRSRKIE